MTLFSGCYDVIMARLTLQQALNLFRLIGRRARGLEPGDDALSRLRLDLLANAPWQWLKTTVAKLTVVFILAVLVAGLFTGGIVVMRALGIER